MVHRRKIKFPFRTIEEGIKMGYLKLDIDWADLVIGTGRNTRLELTDKGEKWFKKHNIEFNETYGQLMI